MKEEEVENANENHTIGPQAAWASLRLHMLAWMITVSGHHIKKTSFGNFHFDLDMLEKAWP